MDNAVVFVKLVWHLNTVFNNLKIKTQLLTNLLSLVNLNYNRIYSVSIPTIIIK